MKISVLGAGVFGMALANTFLDSDNEVLVWSKFEREVIEYQTKYLNLNFTTDLSLAIKDSDLVVVAIPIAFLEETIINLKDICDSCNILIACKGIDIQSGLFAYEIVAKHLNKASLGVISGGTFAKDMNDKKIMGLTLGTDSDTLIYKTKKAFNVNYIKLQCISDIIGVSVCGAIKNIMAIGFGILDGASYPPSSKFLFLTEAIYEIRELIIALGGDSETIMSYAGIDDIMMTCTSAESRNYTLGNMIGKNMDIDKINEYKSNTTIEGLGTSLAVYELSKRKNIKLPISNVIYRILHENADINELIKLLEKRES